MCSQQSGGLAFFTGRHTSDAAGDREAIGDDEVKAGAVLAGPDGSDLDPAGFAIAPFGCVFNEVGAEW
jgi:hypothetical protein